MSESKKENKYRPREETVTIPDSLRSFFEFPLQGVRLTKEFKGYVFLETGDELEIDFDLARFISFALKIRLKEIESKSFDLIKSQLRKKLLMLSNCHRIMLAAVGFRFLDVLENDFGSKIIDNFFLDNPKLKTQVCKWDELENSVNMINTEDFPLLVNIFGPDPLDEHINIAKHSFIILGKTKKGVYICFQKNRLGNGYPIELTSLKTLMKVEADYYGGQVFPTIIPAKKLENLYEEMVRFARKNIKKNKTN